MNQVFDPFIDMLAEWLKLNVGVYEAQCSECIQNRRDNLRR